ncbi:MAG: 50S ribosomal protein L3, partial [Patescibacteria group bacterium]|nr:50S ribosomal protein L3 [Patescibacteria group bacterium]
LPDVSSFKAGQTLSASDFTAGEVVDLSGVMKGRGFTGAVKRHGFHGAPATHGHDHPKAVGSIGSRYPQHTLKGTRMAGRMGGHNVTVKNLSIIDIDPEKNYLIVYGAVPGASGGLVRVKATGRSAKSVIKLFQPSVVSVKAEAKAVEAESQPQAEQPAVKTDEAAKPR